MDHWVRGSVTDFPVHPLVPEVESSTCGVCDTGAHPMNDQITTGSRTERSLIDEAESIGESSTAIQRTSNDDAGPEDAFRTSSSPPKRGDDRRAVPVPDGHRCIQAGEWKDLPRLVRRPGDRFESSATVRRWPVNLNWDPGCRTGPNARTPRAGWTSPLPRISRKPPDRPARFQVEGFHPLSINTSTYMTGAASKAAPV